MENVYSSMQFLNEIEWASAKPGYTEIGKKSFESDLHLHKKTCMAVERLKWTIDYSFRLFE